MTRKAIGIDLGGTDIKAGVVDETGKILSKVKVPTQAETNYKTVTANIARAAQLARAEAAIPWRRIAAVGIGSPGIFEWPAGRIHHIENIRCLKGKPLSELVQRALCVKNKKFVFDNDANMAAFAESWVGAGRGRKTLALMTLGTGIGGGIILDGKIWRGAWGAAAELGHQIVHPTEPVHASGTPGSLEDFASATAVVRRFKDALRSGKRSSLAQRQRKGQRITAKDIADAAKAGDATALDIIRETGKFLGIAATNMCHILNVELVVFAGGLTAAGSILLKPIREEFRRRTFPLARKNVKILFSKLGNDAGLLGAAGMALAEAKTRRTARRTAT